MIEAGKWKDWYTRDAWSYTRSRFKSRLGWEDTLDSEDSYSSYFWKPSTSTEVIKKAYQTARDMIVVINPPCRVSINISGEKESGATDGRVVYIGTKIFDDTVYSEGEKLDIFCGTTIHEGCHLLYTEFTAFEDWSYAAGDIKRSIFNILEDERIEETLGDEKPGLVRFLEKSKYYYFDTLYLERKPAASKKPRNPAEKLLNIFLYAVRYPKYLGPKEVKEYRDILAEIKDVVVPLPADTKGTIQAAEKVYKILLKYYKDMPKPKKKEKEESGGKGEAKEISPESEFKSELEKVIKKLKRSSVLSDPKYGYDATSSSAGLESKEKSTSISANYDVGCAVMELEGRLEYGSTKDVTFKKLSGDKNSYLRAKDVISPYIQAIRKAVQSHSKNYELTHRGCRSGLLDTDKLAEAYQGVPCVYIRKGEVKTNKVTVCVLVDESGSMTCHNREYRARESAVLLNEALGGLAGVDLYIYGHSADEHRTGDTELYIYREPGSSLSRYACGEIHGRYENRDGSAILETAKRVRSKTTEPEILMFVISDGCPAAWKYSGSAAVQDVKDKVAQAERMGFRIVQVTIDGYKGIDQMFKNHIEIKNISDMALKLGRVIKKAVMGAAKTSVY